jgi:hypothetical protein
MIVTLGKITKLDNIIITKITGAARKSTSQVTADQRSATLRELLARSSYRRTVAISGHGNYGD